MFMKKTLLFLSFAFVVASMPIAFAQVATTNAPAATPPSGTAGGQRAEKWKAAFDQLDLTDAQKTQIKQIRDNTQPGPDRRKQIMAVLTPDQKQKLIGILQQARAGQADQ